MIRLLIAGSYQARSLIPDKGKAIGNGISDEALSGNPVALWANSQKLALSGEEEIQKGERRLDQGRKQINEGEASVRRGSDLVSSVRFEYETAARIADTATTPRALAA